MKTDIVYVCSPDWRARLCVSLRTLLQSGTRFDRISIVSVAWPPVPWDLPTQQIRVVHLPRISQEELSLGDGFLPNKVHLCAGAEERLVYLDADTLVGQRLEPVWESRSADVIARPAVRMTEPDWDSKLWSDTVARFGGSVGMPYLNSGFVVLQNGVQHVLRERWLQIMADLANDPLLVQRLHGPRYIEQLALSLALGAVHASWDLMSATEHAYGWRRDSRRAARLYHTGNALFDLTAAAHGLNLETAESDLMRMLREV